MPNHKELFLTLYREATSILQETKQITEEMFTSDIPSSDSKIIFLNTDEANRDE